MKTLNQQRTRTRLGFIFAVGVIALPQAAQAQVRLVSGHPVGVSVLALAGGGGYQAASLGELSVQRLRTWLKLSDETELNGSVVPPSGIKVHRLQVIDPAPVRWGGSNLQ